MNDTAFVFLAVLARSRRGVSLASGKGGLNWMWESNNMILFVCFFFFFRFLWAWGFGLRKWWKPSPISDWRLNKAITKKRNLNFVAHNLANWVFSFVCNRLGPILISDVPSFEFLKWFRSLIVPFLLVINSFIHEKQKKKLKIK